MTADLKHPVRRVPRLGTLLAWLLPFVLLVLTNWPWRYESTGFYFDIWARDLDAPGELAIVAEATRGGWPWSYYESVVQTDDVRTTRWHPRGLIGNIVVGLGLATLVAWGVPRMLCRKRRWLQITLAEVACLTVVVAVSLAYWQARRTRAERQVHAVARLFDLGVQTADVLHVPGGMKRLLPWDYFQTFVIAEQVPANADAFRWLAELSDLEILVLDCEQQPSVSLEVLERLPSLHTLHVKNAEIDLSEFSRIVALPQLEHLLIESSQLEQGCLKRLSTSRDLRDVMLWKTAIRDDDVGHLARLKSLQWLALVDTGINGTALSQLNGHPQLERLQVEGIQGQDVYMGCLPQLNVLKLSSGLRNVRLEDLPALAAMPGSLFETPWTVWSLRCATWSSPGDELWGGIDAETISVSEIPALKELAIGGLNFRSFTCRGLDALERLEVDRTPYNSASGGCPALEDEEDLTDLVAEIQKLNRLQRLVFSHFRLTDSDLNALTSLTDLREIQLYGPNISDDGLRLLQRLPKLVRLKLYSDRITEHGILELVESSRHLTRVDVLGENWDDSAQERLDAILTSRRAE